MALCRFAPPCRCSNTPVLFNTAGLLSVTGQADASLNLPPGLDPSLVGITIAHAYAVFGPPGVTTLHTSNPVTLTLAP